MSSYFVLKIQYVNRPPETRNISAPTTSIGRESGDIVLNDPQTSGRHAEILFQTGQVRVRDVGSTNGTWFNGQRLMEFVLEPGQWFQAGQTTLQLMAVHGEQPSPAKTVMAMGAPPPGGGPGGAPGWGPPGGGRPPGPPAGPPPGPPGFPPAASPPPYGPPGGGPPPGPPGGAPPWGPPPGAPPPAARPPGPPMGPPPGPPMGGPPMGGPPMGAPMGGPPMGGPPMGPPMGGPPMGPPMGGPPMGPPMGGPPMGGPPMGPPGGQPPPYGPPGGPPPGPQPPYGPPQGGPPPYGPPQGGPPPPYGPAGGPPPGPPMGGPPMGPPMGGPPMGPPMGGPPMGGPPMGPPMGGPPMGGPPMGGPPMGGPPMGGPPMGGPPMARPGGPPMGAPPGPGGYGGPPAPMGGPPGPGGYGGPPAPMGAQFSPAPMGAPGGTGVRPNFQGTGGELFVTYLVGMLLTMITAGVYMAWFQCKLANFMLSNMTLGPTRRGDLRLEFTGKGGELFVTLFVGNLLVLITAGIYMSWYIVKLIKFFNNNITATAQDGTRYRLNFEGTGGELFVTFLVGGLLTMITGGIYMSWFICKLRKMIYQRTAILENEQPVGNLDFVGTGGALFVTLFVGMLLTMITATIYRFWFEVKLAKFYSENTRVNYQGRVFAGAFHGTGGEYFVTLLVGGLLCAITAGIYTPWLLIKIWKFDFNNLEFNEIGGGQPGMQAFPPQQQQMMQQPQMMMR